MARVRNARCVRQVVKERSGDERQSGHTRSQFGTLSPVVGDLLMLTAVVSYVGGSEVLRVKVMLVLRDHEECDGEGEWDVLLRAVKERWGQ